MISNFRHVVNVAHFLLGDSPVSAQKLRCLGITQKKEHNNLLLACVTCKTEIMNSAVKDLASVKAKVLLYTLEKTKCWKIGFKPVIIMKKHVFWIVVLCCWVIPAWHFKEMYCLHLQDYESVDWLINLRMKAVYSLKSLGRNYPTTWQNKSQYLRPQQ